ncbi:MAG TPA: hypothetical protein VFO41_02505 [Alphaproteobacteria bacterium]|nr:hypothetical protein [Alphaproteobacteria bacterium]
MKYRSLDEMRTIGPVYRSADLKMSRRERLERWAELLDQHPGPVSVLHETEYRPQPERDALRADASPLAVAFHDPVLRAQGLKDDTYGEATRFFGLSDGEAHLVLCYCHYSRDTVAAREVAGRVRGIAGTLGPAGLLRSLGWVAGACTGIMAIGALSLML